MTTHEVLEFALKPENWDTVAIVGGSMFLLVCFIIALVIVLFKNASTADPYDPKEHLTCGQSRPRNRAHGHHDHHSH